MHCLFTPLCVSLANYLQLSRYHILCSISLTVQSSLQEEFEPVKRRRGSCESQDTALEKSQRERAGERELFNSVKGSEIQQARPD